MAVDPPRGDSSPPGDVFLDNRSSVAEFTPAGLLVQRFGTGQVSGGAGIAVDAATGEVFVPELGEDRVAVFKPEETVEKPVVDGATARRCRPSQSS